MTRSAAFMRFARDKRGYEHFYLVHPATNQRGKTRPRILYWFRTPPGVKVGRLPFDDDSRRALESLNPGVAFDWDRLLATPIPPPSADVERWRERRRAEKAERAARRAENADLEANAEEPGPASSAVTFEDREAVSPDADPGNPEGRALSAPAAAAGGQPGSSESVSPSSSRRRRRRRRGGRTGEARVSSPSAASGQSAPNPSNSTTGDE